VAVFPQSLSPGNEQADFWSREAASTPGSRNLASVSDPVVDELIAGLIAAPDRAALVARTRALDRVLLSGHYVIPHWHITAFRVAYWNRFGRPATAPTYDLGFETWWKTVDGGR
jgi:microcin C transport system substrate-binding protein